jgi:hypothetical protein
MGGGSLHRGDFCRTVRRLIRTICLRNSASSARSGERSFLQSISPKLLIVRSSGQHMMWCTRVEPQSDSHKRAHVRSAASFICRGFQRSFPHLPFIVDSSFGASKR